MADINLNVPAIEKLLGYGKSAVGAVAGPILANWKAVKEGRARLTSARFNAEVQRIEAESRAQSLVAIAEGQAKALQSVDTTIESARRMVEITPEDITQSIEFQDRKRLANVASVVESAADELGDKEVSDHEPDPDWTARFFNDVQDVSSEDMQKIWARILAGEVESPGRTSLRTLDTLKNMAKKDAVKFKDICNFVFNNDFIFYDNSAKAFGPLNYSNLLHLQDCGLVNVGPSLVKEFRLNNQMEIPLMCQDFILVITRNADPIEVLKIPDVLLTSAGRELSSFVQSSMHMEYLRAFSAFLKTKNCTLDYLEGVTRFVDGSLNYAKRISIEPLDEQLDGPTP